MDVNEAINYSYKSQNIIRIGGEYRYGVFSFRGGFGYADSPYDHDINDGSRISYSAGVGFRDMYYFIDFAWVHSQQTQDYYPYTITNTTDYAVTKSVNDISSNSFLLTFGFKF